MPHTAARRTRCTQKFIIAAVSGEKKVYTRNEFNFMRSTVEHLNALMLPAYTHHALHTNSYLSIPRKEEKKKEFREIARKAINNVSRLSFPISREFYLGQRRVIAINAI